MSHAEMLLVALALDALFGEPEWLWSRVPHPVVAMGRALARAETALNHGPARRARGVAVVLGLGAAAALLGGLIAALPDAGLLEAVAAATLLAQRSLADHVSAVAGALARSLPEGRLAVSRIVGRDVTALDGPGVARAAIESAAENFSDGVIAPAVWFLLLGLPGLALYKLVNTADSMIGHMSPRYREFGWAAARLDDAMNWAPARLTGGLICLAARSTAAWRGMRAEARQHASPNAGWPEAAMAGALGVALAGPRSYEGRAVAAPWMNSGGSRTPGPRDIARAVALTWRAWGIVLLALGLLALAG
ncbi:cobalamin biosynthesis protein [Paroceanicella profunda]|uniref:Cobalamin biosynthesis protein CobD n=1 Tax=Paroceanicella profunda TaxID=2579971 RepID=A0A5B8FUF9_9RHOB|nr:adenosylcobinamide-phosphate synthase CbiB [Paroceanicella profunda]QDL92015.1 cobalamin biosynthesis protein [Paroceanicella profunda]